MKFKYQPYLNLTDQKGEFLMFPMLHICLKNGRKSLNLRALVDSGASTSLFNIDVADALGIDLSSAQKRDYYGIGERTIQGYVHPIKLNVGGFARWITIDAGFIENDEMPLLGQAGFFDSYEVIFRKFQNKFEIRPPKKVKR